MSSTGVPDGLPGLSWTDGSVAMVLALSTDVPRGMRGVSYRFGEVAGLPLEPVGEMTSQEATASALEPVSEARYGEGWRIRDQHVDVVAPIANGEGPAPEVFGFLGDELGQSRIDDGIEPWVTVTRRPDKMHREP